VKPAAEEPSLRGMLRAATLELRRGGCGTPRLDAELLLANVCGHKRAWLFAHAEETAAPHARTTFSALVSRRARREPLAYILGYKEFWSREFAVSPAVLIPRPETEHLIEASLECFPDRDRRLRICDIGTGSGCLAVTLACEYPRATIVGTDLSPEALEIARSNAVRHGVADRIRWRRGDLFAALRNSDGPFDLIVSNPPYVSEREIRAAPPELPPAPRLALLGGEDGLLCLRRLLDPPPDILAHGGRLIVECGNGGLPSTTRLPLVKPIHDLAGRLRGGVFAPRV